MAECSEARWAVTMVASKAETTAVRRDACWVGLMVALMEASMAVRWEGSTAVMMVVHWAGQKAGNLEATLG